MFAETTYWIGHGTGIISVSIPTAEFITSFAMNADVCPITLTFNSNLLSSGTNLAYLEMIQSGTSTDDRRIL